MKNKKILIWILILLISLLSIIILMRYFQNQSLMGFDLKSFSPKNIKHFVLSFGNWALVIFISLYALNTVSLLPPIGIISLSAGFIFGPLQGIIALMLGGLIGTTATFFIGRYLGREWIENIIKGKAKELLDKLDHNGFQVILIIRLIPLIPWEVVNYASGLSKIKYIDFISATLIGIFPMVLIQTFFSDQLSNLNLKEPILFIMLGAFLLLGAIPIFYLKNNNHFLPEQS